MQPTNYATSLSSQFVADYPHEQYWCGLPPFSVISLSRASLRLMPPGAYEVTSPTRSHFAYYCFAYYYYSIVPLGLLYSLKVFLMLQQTREGSSNIHH